MVVRLHEGQESQEEELKRLTIEESESIERARQLAKSHDKEWKQEVKILAEILEKKYTLIGQEWLLNTISIEITRIYRDNDIKVWPHVHDYLPARFKKVNDSSSSSRQEGRDPSEQFIIETIQNYQAITNNIDLIPQTLYADICSSSKQIYSQIKKKADIEHVALIPDDNSSNTDQINDSMENDRDHVTIDKPKPRGSLTYDEINLTIQDLTQVRDRVFEFPPEILEKDQEIALGWRSWRVWMNPALDLKYSKNWLDWFRTEKARDIYGKHAAAVMSFSLTNLCANCSDEKTKEWVRMEPVLANTFQTYRCLQCQYQIDTVCPACNLSMKMMDKSLVGWQCSECDGTVPLTRDLTREQVGDKSSIIIDAALDIIDHIPSQIAFCSWYSDWIEPRIGGRKARLSEGLSEKA